MLPPRALLINLLPVEGFIDEGARMTFPEAKGDWPPTAFSTLLLLHSTSLLHLLHICRITEPPPSGRILTDLILDDKSVVRLFLSRDFVSLHAADDMNNFPSS